MPTPSRLPQDFHTATQRIDPDHTIRKLIPPSAGELLALVVLVALVATLIFLPVLFA